MHELPVTDDSACMR